MFNEHVVIITGASSGIGEALAFQLADQGARLVLAARRGERLEVVAEACREAGSEVLVVPTDVREETQCRALVERTVAAFGQIDVLINNAGFGIEGRFDQLPDLDRFRDVIDTNLMGAVYCTYYALPLLKETRGRIVGVSSVVGKVASAGNGAYAASKFAMNGFFDSLRLDLYGSGVSVTMIYPGFVVTEFVPNMIKLDGQKAGPRASGFYNRRMMSAERCAELILNDAWRRRRERVMSLGGKLGVVGARLWPRVADRLVLWVTRMVRQRQRKNR